MGNIRRRGRERIESFWLPRGVVNFIQWSVIFLQICVLWLFTYSHLILIWSGFCFILTGSINQSGTKFLFSSFVTLIFPQAPNNRHFHFFKRVGHAFRFILLESLLLFPFPTSFLKSFLNQKNANFIRVVSWSLKVHADPSDVVSNLRALVIKIWMFLHESHR